MFEAYRVGIALALDNKLSAPLLAISRELMQLQERFSAVQKSITAATADSGKFVRQINSTQKAIDRLNTAMGKTPKDWGSGINMPSGGGGIPGGPAVPGGKPPGGKAPKDAGPTPIEMAAYGYQLRSAARTSASPVIAAVTSAATLQKEMIGIQQATGATNAQVDAMRASIESTAGNTMFSAIDVAEMAKTIGTGTTLKADQVTALLPEYAKFADVQLLLKGTPAQQSVKDAVKLAHTAGHYAPEELREYLNLLTRLSMVIPGGLGEAGNALKYSQSEAKRALGVGDRDMVEMIALLNQLGLSGSRGGTGFIAAASRSIPGVFGSGLLKGKSAKALAEMGMADASGKATFFENGKFSTHLWMQQLSKFVADTFKSMPEAEARTYILKHFRDSMGVNGSRVANLLADDAALKQLVAIDEKFRLLPDNAKTQGKFADESVSQAFENSKTNFTSLLTELGTPLLPIVNDGLHKVNDEPKELIKKAHDHSGVVKGLGISIGGLSVLVGLSGVILGLKFAFMGLGAALKVSGLGKVATVAKFLIALPFKLLRVALSSFALLFTSGPIGWTILGIGAVVAGGYLVYKHWDQIKPKLFAVWDGIKSWMGGIVDWLTGLWQKVQQSASSVGDQASGAFHRAEQKLGLAPSPATNPATRPANITPPPPKESVIVQTILNVDGRKLAEAMTPHQTRAMSSGAMSSGQRFNGGMTPWPVGGM